MKRIVLSSLLWATMVSSVWSQFTWPEEQTTVRIDGVPVVATWRHGRPFVSRDATLAVLHIRSGPDDLDLRQVLEERGYLCTLNADGSIDCVRPRVASSAPPQWGRASQEPAVVRVGRNSRKRRFTSRTVSSRPQPARPSVDQYSALVDAIGQEVARFSRRPIAWTFTVVSDSDPNAWTPGEGRVFITTGLLNLGLTRDEIAGVLGHEIAHGARQHLAQDDLQRQREARTGREIQAARARYEKARRDYERSAAGKDPNSLDAMMAKDKLDWETSVARGRANTLKKEVDSHRSYHEHKTVFSHAHEREADAIGLGYAIAAGYRADGLLTALQKIQAADYQEYGSRALAGSKTHPPLPERIARLQEVMRQLGY